MTDGGETPIICPYIAYRLKLLRGRVKFPTGGKARELSHAQPIRCDSGADSTVWMREERNREITRFRAKSSPPLKVKLL